MFTATRSLVALMLKIFRMFLIVLPSRPIIKPIMFGSATTSKLTTFSSGFCSSIVKSELPVIDWRIYSSAFFMGLF